MSNEDDGPEKKEAPLISSPKEHSKSKIIKLYGLTVGAVLLIIIIVFIIAVQVGGNPSEKKQILLHVNIFQITIHMLNYLI